MKVNEWGSETEENLQFDELNFRFLWNAWFYNVHSYVPCIVNKLLFKKINRIHQI